LLRSAAARPHGPLLIGGCQASETSADVLIDHDYHGALTYTLVKTLEQARGRITYRGAIREVRRLVKTYGTRQTPQLEGAAARLGRLFITQARPGTPTRRAARAGRTAPRARRGRGELPKRRRR
jgi:hypothetical protein